MTAREATASRGRPATGLGGHEKRLAGRPIRLAVQALLLLFAAASIAHAQVPETVGSQGKSLRPASSTHGKKSVKRKGLSGVASYYAKRFHGRKTASGHPYFNGAMTAAHRSLPLGTWVRVVNDRNGNYVVVQITDRGPYAGNRVIDLSLAAATQLDMLDKGIAPVHLEVVQDYPQIDESGFPVDMQIASAY